MIGAAQSIGVASLVGDNFQGVIAAIRSNNLNTSNNSRYFANNHLWIYDSGLTNWIEAGITIGKSSQLDVGSPTFEWADQRPNGGGYHEHILGSAGDAAYNTDYGAYMYSLRNGDWQINVNGYIAYSTSNIGSGQNIFAGSETTDPSGARVCSYSYNLAYYDQNDNYVFGWQDASNGQATILANNPPSAYWVSRPTSLRSYDNVSC